MIKSEVMRREVTLESGNSLDVCTNHAVITPDRSHVNEVHLDAFRATF